MPSINGRVVGCRSGGSTARLLSMLVWVLAACTVPPLEPAVRSVVSAEESAYPGPVAPVCVMSGCRNFVVDVDGDGVRDVVGWNRGADVQTVTVRRAVSPVVVAVDLEYVASSDRIAAIEAQFIELNGRPGVEVVLPVDAKSGARWFAVLTWHDGALAVEPGLGPLSWPPTHYWSFGNEDESADVVRCTTPGRLEWIKLREPEPDAADDPGSWRQQGVVDFVYEPSYVAGTGSRFRQVAARGIETADARRTLSDPRWQHRNTDWINPFQCRPTIPGLAGK